MQFNTAISQMMIFINQVVKEDVLPKEYAEGFIKLLNPIAPHITEEIWNRLGHDNTISYEPWPTYDEAKTIEDEIEIPVQINGKVKVVVNASKDATEEEVKEIVNSNEVVKRNLEGKNVVKEIYIGGRIYNIVIK